MVKVIGMTSGSDGLDIVFDELFDCIPRRGDLIQVSNRSKPYMVEKVIWDIQDSNRLHHRVVLTLEAVEE
jgi:hypothetical protein